MQLFGLCVDKCYFFLRYIAFRKVYIFQCILKREKMEILPLVKNIRLFWPFVSFTGRIYIRICWLWMYENNILCICKIRANFQRGFTEANLFFQVKALVMWRLEKVISGKKRDKGNSNDLNGPPICLSFIRLGRKMDRCPPSADHSVQRCGRDAFRPDRSDQPGPPVCVIVSLIFITTSAA